MLTIENEKSHASDMTFEDLFKQYYAYAVKRSYGLLKSNLSLKSYIRSIFTIIS